MNQSRSISYEDHASDAVGHMQKLVLLVSLVGFSLYSIVLVPIFTQLNADIAYQETFMTYFLYYAYKAVELAVFFIVFPATVFAVFRGGLWGSRSVWITFILTTLWKYVANFAMDCIVDGAIPSFDFFVNRDLPIILPLILMELGQYIFILLISALIIQRKKNEHQLDHLLDADKAGDVRSIAFPITKIFTLKNPVQASSFAAAVFLFVARAFSHLMYQLAQLVNTGDWEGSIILTVDLVSDLLLSAILYFVMVLLLSTFDKREVQALSASAKEGAT